MNFKDKLGRRIEVGNIIACSSSYRNEIMVGKVTSVSNKAVNFILYGGKKDGIGSVTPHAQLDIQQLKEEPNSWSRWTKNPEKVVLILKK